MTKMTKQQKRELVDVILRTIKSEVQNQMRIEKEMMDKFELGDNMKYYSAGKMKAYEEIIDLLQ